VWRKKLEISYTELSHGFVIKNCFSNLSFLRELVIAARFSLVGIAATSIHIVVVLLVLNQAGSNPFSANAVAFVIAFGISFLGKYIWTFRSPGSPRRAMFRFCSNIWRRICGEHHNT
jgi:putative flippase GtrA